MKKIILTTLSLFALQGLYAQQGIADRHWELAKTEVWKGAELEKNTEIEESYSRGFVPGQFGLTFAGDSAIIEINSQSAHGTLVVENDKIVVKTPCNCADKYKTWEFFILNQEPGALLLRLNDEDEGSHYYITLLFKQN